MKLFSFIFLALIAFNSYSQEADFGWLEGEWIRTNDKAGNITREHWFQSSENEFKGIGFTLKNKDTIFKETLRLYKTPGNWILEINGVNEDPTLFKLIEIGKKSFTSINPDNNFPKIIAYSKKDSLLIATISDENDEILFKFKNAEID